MYNNRVSLGESASLTDDELVAAFEDVTLSDHAFRHPDHVRLAWIYLRRLPLLEALRLYRDGLRRFAGDKGAPGKYHETVTWAFLILIHERLHDADADEGWPEFVHRNPDLVRFKDGALFQYYDAGILDSEVARNIFVLPKPELATGFDRSSTVRDR